MLPLNLRIANDATIEFEGKNFTRRYQRIDYAFFSLSKIKPADIPRPANQ